MRYTTICLFLLSTIFGSCSMKKNAAPTIQQGVSGRVLWLEGNQMPSIGTATKTGPAPVSRTVHIYQLTNNTQIEGQMPLFDAVKTKLVAKVKTDKDGYFQCPLLPGRYSIFTVEEGGKLFASLGDGDGNITPFEVKANEVTKFDININYKAAY